MVSWIECYWVVGVLWDVHGTQAVVQRDTRIWKDSCIWGFWLVSYKRKMLKCKYANAIKIPVTSRGPRGAERGCRDYQEHRGAKGGLEDRGGYGLPWRASAGPGIAEEVLVSKTRVLVPGGHSGQSLIFSYYRLVMWLSEIFYLTVESPIATSDAPSCGKPHPAVTLNAKTELHDLIDAQSNLIFDCLQASATVRQTMLRNNITN